MSYQVGIDVGTTYTAAAVYRDGAATIFTLGTRSAAIPSVVLLREDGTILVGDAAERRAMSEPERVVREFKRRLGDTTPLIVGGSPYSAEQLTARLLESVVEQIRAREGGAPTCIVVTHPANWGNYKRDLLDQAVRLAGLEAGTVDYLTEPEAAALSYAAHERVAAGEIVAVYDLGGGTFDAAVLQRTTDGFSIIGRPEGIERLGGIDFDAAVFAHVTSGLTRAMAELDHNDPAALAAVARLRQDCVEAKEALSSDTDASIPVLLPTMQTEVRITRHEFETIIRPSLLDSVEAMKRAIRSAGVEVDDVSRVLLVGGSSRIPLISLLVSSELGRPVAVDTHPKHAVAIGAAFAASGLLGSAPEEAPPAVAPAGVDPNLTVVAPAHLLNPVQLDPSARPSPKRSALPVEGAGAGGGRSSGLPVEGAGAGGGRSSGLPVEGAGARRLGIEGPSLRGEALPIERPGGSASKPGESRPVPGEPPSPQAGPLPIAGRSPSSAQSPRPRRSERPLGPPAPPPRPGEREPSPHHHRSAAENERTRIYPGGTPPGMSDREPATRSRAARRDQPRPKRSKSGIAVVLLVLVAIAVVVAIIATSI